MQMQPGQSQFDFNDATGGCFMVNAKYPRIVGYVFSGIHLILSLLCVVLFSSLYVTVVQKNTCLGQYGHPIYSLYTSLFVEYHSYPLMWFVTGCLGFAAARTQRNWAIYATLLTSAVSMLGLLAYFINICNHLAYEDDKRDDSEYTLEDSKDDLYCSRVIGILGVIVFLSLLEGFILLATAILCGVAVNNPTKPLHLPTHQLQQQPQPQGVTNIAY